MVLEKSLREAVTSVRKTELTRNNQGFETLKLAPSYTTLKRMAYLILLRKQFHHLETKHLNTWGTFSFKPPKRVITKALDIALKDWFNGIKGKLGEFVYSCSIFNISTDKW